MNEEPKATDKPGIGFFRWLPPLVALVLFPISVFVAWPAPPAPENQPRAAFASNQQGPITSLAISPDGKTLASGGTDGRILLRSTDDGTIARTLVFDSPSEARQIRPLIFASDGKTLVSADIPPAHLYVSSKAKAVTVKLWDLDLGRVKSEFTTSEWRQELTLLEDGQTVAVEESGPPDVLRVTRRHLESGRVLSEQSFPKKGIGASSIHGAAVSPDGKHAAIWGVNAKSIAIVDTVTGGVLRSLSAGVPSGIMGVQYAAGDVIAVTHRLGMEIFDVSTGERMASANLTKELERVRSTVVSVDGRRCVVLGYKTESRPFPNLLRSIGIHALDTVGTTFIVLDTKTGRIVKSLSRPGYASGRFAISKDGRLLAVVEQSDPNQGEKILVWDLPE